MPSAAEPGIGSHRQDRVWNSGRAVVLLLVVGFLWAGGAVGERPSQAAAQEQHYTVLKVYDGDTILVAGGGQRRLVRLLGIDAPETSKTKGKPGQPYSRKARRHLADLILKQSVTLETYGEDRYGRILAVVRRGGRDINNAMIDAGLAEVYRGRTPAGFDIAPYLSTQARARKSQAGMWRQGSAYVSPMRWKHPR